MISKEIHTLLTKVQNKQKLLQFLRKHMTDKRSDRFEEVLKYRTRHFTVAIEDVYQERNASAVVRTADCFGIQDVHIIENYNEYKLSKEIAKGSDKWVDVCIYDEKKNNSLVCMDKLRKKGYKIIATTPHAGDQLIQDYDISERSAIFLGGEKEGLSKPVLDQADGFVKIPMYGFTESFNLSVAGALVLYDLTTRLHQSGIPWQLSEEEKAELRLDWTIRTIASARFLIEKFIQSLDG